MRKYTIEGQDYFVPDNFYIVMSRIGCVVEAKSNKTLVYKYVSRICQKDIDEAVNSLNNSYSIDSVFRHVKESLIVENKEILLPDNIYFTKGGGYLMFKFKYTEIESNKLKQTNVLFKHLTILEVELALVQITTLMKHYEALGYKIHQKKKLKHTLITETEEETIKQLIIEEVAKEERIIAEQPIPTVVTPPVPLLLENKTTPVLETSKEEPNEIPAKEIKPSSFMSELKESLNNFKTSILDRITRRFGF